MNHQIDITPDVDLLENLRHSGISNMAALGEFLDNSVDADARRIQIQIYNSDEKYRNIMIIDNGRGINETNIQGALTLAKSMKVGLDQLGKFGMGMKTAALSLTTNFEILTKTTTGSILFASFNITKMRQAGKYYADLRDATKEECSFFNDKLNNPTSGTILILKYCDKINARTNADFKDETIQYIGRVYRRLIERGTIFEVKDEESNTLVPIIDPLMRNDHRTTPIADREIHQIKYSSQGKVLTANIEISATILPATNTSNKYELKINQTNQGIYILRQNREIAHALAYSNVWGIKHNSKNRIRVEMYVKPELDEVLRIDFNKGKGVPSAEFKNQLAKIIRPILAKCNVFLKPEKDPVQPEIGTEKPVVGVDKPVKPIELTGTSIDSDDNPPIGSSSPEVVVSTPQIKIEVPDTVISTDGEKYKIIEKIAVFSEKNGYNLEMNVVSWAGNTPVIDLRYWNQDTGLPREGISLTPSDVKNLKVVLEQLTFE
jgi:hypothetical protein